MISTPGTALLTTRSLMSAQSFDRVSPGDARGGYDASAPRSPTIMARGIACSPGHPSQVSKPTISTGPISLKASYPSFHAEVHGPREPLLRHRAATSTVLVPPGPSGPWQSERVAGREVLSVAGQDERGPGDPSRNTCSSKVLSGTSRSPGDRGPLPNRRSAIAFMKRNAPLTGTAFQNPRKGRERGNSQRAGTMPGPPPPPAGCHQPGSVPGEEPQYCGRSPG